MTINISASSLNHSWLSRHSIKKHIKPQGAYLAFIVALALEMFGILLSLYSSLGYLVSLFQKAFSGAYSEKYSDEKQELRHLETTSCLMLCPVAIPFLSEPL